MLLLSQKKTLWVPYKVNKILLAIKLVSNILLQNPNSSNTAIQIVSFNQVTLSSRLKGKIQHENEIIYWIKEFLQNL